MLLTARTTAWLVAIIILGVVWIGWMKSTAGPGASPVATAATDHAHGDHGSHAAAVSRIVTTTFDRHGVLNAVEAAGNRVLFSTSHDDGRTFSAPVEVAVEAEGLDANGEARPKIAIGAGDEILVSWTRKGEALYTGDIRFARSIDGGRTFSRPVTVNDDALPIGHRFDSLAVAPDGTIVVAWIDKRDLERATTDGEAYRGAAVYVATSTDAGGTFSPNRKVADHSCECCRIAIAFERDSTPVLFWRHVLEGGIRDHVVARLEPGLTADLVRIDHENWRIDACPHHGPAMAITPGGGYHFAWFTGAESTGNAVFYTRSTDTGQTIDTPVRIGTGSLAGHPSLAVASGRVWLAWKEWPDDDTTRIMAMSSVDDGVTWSTPRELASAGINSDRPFLIAQDDEVFLSWADPDTVRIVPVS